MININLLPQVLRKKERTPLPHLLGFVGAICAFLLLFYVIFDYEMNIIPSLQNTKSNLQQEKTRLQQQVEELKRINAEIARLSSFVDAVKGLYRQRVVWSKVLSDIKHIVNFDPSMSEYNADMRYIWFTKLTGSGKNITINGFATSSNQLAAMQMPERLLERILSYAPITLPEKDEEVRLQEELRAAQTEHDALRRDNPELPLQGPRELAIQQRLEEIKNIKSGGIALQPFSSILEPGSLRLVNTAWSAAPTARRRPVGLEELFPAQAWSFGINMRLR